MQNNSNNSNTGWRQRLDEFEDISGNNLEINSAWERLQQKKAPQKTSGSKKWIWLAAACFICVLVSLVFLLDNKTDQPVTPDLVEAYQPKKEIEKKIVIENTPEKIIAIKQPSIQKNIITTQQAAIIKSSQSPEALLVVEESKTPSQIISPIDSIATPQVPAIAVAKKLKLVHINELNQPQQGIAKEEGKPYFPITYQTKQVYTNNSSDTKKDKDNLIRIKLN